MRVCERERKKKGRGKGHTETGINKEERERGKKIWIDRHTERHKLTFNYEERK